MKQFLSNTLISLLVATILCVPTQSSAAGKISNARLRELIDDFDNCTIKSVYSYIYPAQNPPTTIETLKKSCSSQSEGFKCLKESSRSLTPLLRRGILTLLQNRQRFHKKYCTNPQSDISNQFLAAMKCIDAKRRPAYVKLDSEYTNGLVEIENRHFTDSSTELKYLCCSTIGYRQGYVDALGSECAMHKPVVDEMIRSMVPTDISLICEDEDRLLSKVCPTIEKLEVPKTFDPAKSKSPSSTGLYLVATLGEA